VQNYQIPGMELMLLPLNSMLDQWMYLLIKMYFMPYELAGRGDEIDKWISQFSLNGIKQASICKV
jgi:hypothetical protein